MAGPTREFWDERYRSQQHSWDRGEVSPQLLAWLDSGELQPPLRIAVPGCGSGWEVLELASRGFDVIAIDYSTEAVELTQSRLKDAGLNAEVVHADVLHWHPEQPVDAIYEQTCLCALHPDHWVEYAESLSTWLAPQGRLMALFMQRPTSEAATGVIHGPPYHCDINAMRALFTSQHWDWPKPPYADVKHPNGLFELALPLKIRN
jgi:SAM-dependent methyltransferase